jgi:hypothetical protein
MLRSAVVLTLALALGCSDAGDSRSPPCGRECDPDPLPWGVNDVSILYPSPEPGDAGSLLGMADGSGSDLGPLLPETLFQRLGQDTMYLTESPDRDEHYPHLRVVSARFDPCFEQRAPSALCRRAVRLVAQPIWELEGANGEVIANDVYDASIHLFYELPDEDFVALTLGYKALVKGEAIAGPLGVHPVMEREGLGDFARELNGLLLRHCGERNLIRMTLMATGRSGSNWFWGVFDRKASGAFELGSIPTMRPSETVDSFEIPPDQDPATLPKDDGFPVALLYEGWVDRMTEAELREAAADVYRIENPALVDSTNVRCSHCHLAGRSLDIAFRRRGLELPEDTAYAPPPGQNVEVRDPARHDRHNMHGFSYFKEDRAVSRRAVKESAASAAFLASEAFAETLSAGARATWIAAR